MRRAITMLNTNPFLYFKQRKFWMRRPQLTKSGTSWQNCQHGKRRKSRARKRSSKRQRKREGRFILLLWWTYMPPQKLGVGQKYQKYKGLVVLRGDVVEDDAGSDAVFTKQGSSASHMTVAEVLDVIARLPGCAGQASDTVSSDIKMKAATTLLKLAMSECPDVWIRLPRYNERFQPNAESMELTRTQMRFRIADSSKNKTSKVTRS